MKLLKQKLRDVLKEKEKLEKTQIDLTNKLMEKMKSSKQEREEMLNSQKHAYENKLNFLTKELNLVKEEFQKEKSELTNKIEYMKHKLADRDE